MKSVKMEDFSQLTFLVELEQIVKIADHDSICFKNALILVKQMEFVRTEEKILKITPVNLVQIVKIAAQDLLKKFVKMTVLIKIMMLRLI